MDNRHRYRIGIKKSALKEIAALPQSIRIQAIETIEKLKTNPRPDNCIKLKGYNSLYRVRIRDYRIVYRISDGDREITITRVAHRKEVYE